MIVQASIAQTGAPPLIIATYLTARVIPAVSGPKSGPKPGQTFDDSTLDRLRSLVKLGRRPQQDPNRVRAPAYVKPGTFSPAALGNIQVWPEGNLIKVGKPTGERWQVGGGARGTVGVFSRASRRRMMEALAKIKGADSALFVTLTYPAEYSRDPRSWKRDLDAFAKRLKRDYPASAYIWRLEPQKRGAPHYHLLIYGLGSLTPELREWIRLSWYEVVGSGDPLHLRHGTWAQWLNGKDAIKKYVSKYQAKIQAPVATVDPSTGELLQEIDWSQVGRWWGIRYSADMPWSECVGGLLLTYDEAVTLMRCLRRYLRAHGIKISGCLPSMTVFVENPGFWLSVLDRLLHEGILK